MFVPQSKQQEEKLAVNNAGTLGGEPGNAHDLAPMLAAIPIPLQLALGRAAFGADPRSLRSAPGAVLELGTHARGGCATVPAWAGPDGF